MRFARPASLILLAALAGGLLLAACGGEESEVQRGRVAGDGMAPALNEGDEFEYEPRDQVNVGDIVAFEHNAGPGQPSMFIKRVVAVAGQTVEVADGMVLVDGMPLDQSDYEATAPAYTIAPTEVPADHVFVLGDRRENGRDSSEFGPIPLSAVHGVVLD